MGSLSLQLNACALLPRDDAARIKYFVGHGVMAESFEYKALLSCFDHLVTALKFDPASLSAELAAKGLVPPGEFSYLKTSSDQARELAGSIWTE